MLKIYRLFFFLALSTLFCLWHVKPAAALDIYWKPSEEKSGYSQRIYSTTNKVDIQVRVEDAEEVKINGEEAIQIGGDDSDIWLLEEYMLKAGDNIIRASVKFHDRASDDEENRGELVIKVIDNPDTGGTRYFQEIGGGITAFDGAVKLTLPRDAFITQGTSASWDQSITISTTKALFQLSPQYVALSPVYTINAPSPSYSVSTTGELTLAYNNAGGAGIAARDHIAVLYARPNLLYPAAMQRLNYYNLTDNNVTVPFSQNGFGHYLVVRVIQDFQDFYLKAEGKTDLEWSRTYVINLWSRGIMDELDKYPDGTPVPPGFFGLANSSGKAEINITRKEFITMLAKGLRLPLTISLPHLHTFRDMQGLDIQEVQYIEAAVRAGWISTTPAKNGQLYFRPNEPLTREQACTIMARAAALELPGEALAGRQLQAYFPNDYHSTYSWNRPHIIAAIRAGLLPLAEKGYLRPDKPVTRAGAAQMVYKVIANNSSYW